MTGRRPRAALNQTVFMSRPLIETDPTRSLGIYGLLHLAAPGGSLKETIANLNSSISLGPGINGRDGLFCRFNKAKQVEVFG